MLENSYKENRKRVAKEVIKDLENGKKISVARSAKKVGYSPSYINSRGSKDIRESEEFKGELMKYTNELEGLLNDAVEIAQNKKRYATYRDSIHAIKVLTETSRLINDRSTSNESIQVTWKE